MPPDTTFYLGTSGWAHRDWVGRLYPHDMPASAYLSAYARHFRAVEIESTFFTVPPRERVRSWARRTPDDFRFCPCVPREITHERRLRDAQGPLQDFLGLMGELGDRLGPVLVQLPHDFRFGERTHLQTFLEGLPNRARVAIEFRHGSWLKALTFELLEAHQVGWVIVDAPFLPRLARVTAPFAYVRWHGRKGRASRAPQQLDPATGLRPWVATLRELGRQAGQVYGFVQNRYSGYAPQDVTVLRALLGEDVTAGGKGE